MDHLVDASRMYEKRSTRVYNEKTTVMENKVFILPILSQCAC